MEKQNEAAGNCPEPEPHTTTHDDHQDQSVDHDHDQHMMKNKSSNEQVHDDQDVDQDLPFVCPVCHERFRTEEALGSHKKAHNLSPENKIDEDSTNSAKPAVTDRPDFETSLKQKGTDWSITAKRGSGESTGFSSPAASKLIGIPGMDSAVDDAAVDLMVLAHHKPGARAELMSIVDQIRKEKGKTEYDDEEENSAGLDLGSKECDKNENKIKKRRKKMKLSDGDENNVS